MVPMLGAHWLLGNRRPPNALVGRCPDTKLAQPDIIWPPLDGKPKKEKFGVLDPIDDFDVEAAEREDTDEDA